MTKKKLAAFISLAFAVIMIITSVMLFYAYMPSLNFVGNYQLMNSNINNNINIYNLTYNRFEDAMDFNSLMGAINGNTIRLTPTIYALIDPETGEIVEQSSSVVSISYIDKSERRRKVSFNADKYMTTEVKNVFLELEESGNGSYVEIAKIELKESEENFEIISMLLSSYDGETREIRFSDEKPDLIIDGHDGESNIGYAIYEPDESHFNHRYYEWLRNFIAEKAEEVKAGKYKNGGGGFTGSKEAYCCDLREIGDKTYVMCIASTHSRYYDTLKYTSFTESLIIILVLFTLIYGAVIIAASKLYDKNQKLNQSLRAFTSAAAHELKTPLSVIQNQCECIIENVAPEKNEDYIKSVYDEAVRMNGIVSSFLQYNRLVNADKLQKEKCSLREIVLTEIEKYKAFADMRGVTINAEISADEITVNCNRDLISMAVDNYLSNAIKYATGEKRVTLKLQNSRFSVYNTCEGISADTAESMWDILSRDNKARTKDGSSTGMGLPICAEIFKAHGYEYGYRNVKDGVEFYFAAK